MSKNCASRDAAQIAQFEGHSEKNKDSAFESHPGQTFGQMEKRSTICMNYL